MVELWDAYNEQEEKLGFDLTKGEPFPDGVFQMVAQILIRHEDGDYLLMQRSLDKKLYPSHFETSGGGAVLKGESSLEGAIREAFEETGLLVSDARLVNKAVSHWFSPTIYHYYVGVTHSEKDSVALQVGETMAYKWLTKEEFLDFMDFGASIRYQAEGFAPYLEELRKEEATS